MAKKKSASILTRLQGLIKSAPEKSLPPKENAKRSEKRQPAEPSADAAKADRSTERAPEPDKKPTAKQPWYRHRQRW